MLLESFTDSASENFVTGKLTGCVQMRHGGLGPHVAELKISKFPPRCAS